MASLLSDLTGFIEGYTRRSTLVNRLIILFRSLLLSLNLTLKKITKDNLF